MKHLLLLVLFFCFFSVKAQVSPEFIAQAKQALANGDFENAATLASEGMAKLPSKTSEEYHALIDIFIEAKIASNDMGTAMEATQNYLSVLSNAYGKEDTSLVTYIATLGSIHYMNGYYSDAINSFEQCISLLEKKGLSASRDYAELKNNLGMLYSQTGEIGKAIAALDQSRIYFEKDAAAYTMELALVYNNLGDAYHNKYDYSKADQYYNKALAAFEKSGDQSSPDYLNTLGNYSLLLLDKGQPTAAIQNLIKNKNTAEQSVGKETPEYATALNNLGQAYKQAGNYRLAETYLTESYEIKKRIYQQEHPDRMNAVNNLAMFYYTLGQYDRAETMLKELTAINRQYHKDDLPQLLLYTNNLSVIYHAQNKLAKAQQAAQEVVKLVEKTKGQNSVEYFQAYNGYSSLLLEDNSKLEEAYANYVKVSSLYNTLKLQLPNEDAIAYLNNKGTAAMYIQRHPEAMKDFQEGMKQVEDIYGTQHPDYYLFKSNLAYDLTLQGKNQEASQLLLESAQYRLRKVTELFPSLTESEKEFYIQTVQADLAHYYVFAIKNHQQYPSLTADMANLRLQSKSLVMRSQNEVRNKIINSGNQSLIDEYKKLTEGKKELAKYRTLSKKDLAKLNINLETEALQVEQLEKQLAKNSEYLIGQMENSNWKSIAANLKMNEAAVEVIRVTENFYPQSKVVYYAFLIIKNGQTYPELIVANNGTAMEKKEFSFYINSIHHKLENKNSYNIYWAELAKKLKGITKVYVSPDGIYHKINLNTLYHPETQKYLLDEIDIEIKASLGRPVGALTKPSSDIYLVGHPNYYLDLKEALSNYSKGKSPKARTISTEDTEWSDLPGTKEEVAGIEQVLAKGGWKVVSYTEEHAIENKVKTLQQPRILHLATHGFFEQVIEDSLSHFSSSYFVDPLLRSGLALSGAGVSLSPRDLENIQLFEDGILYANEALSLNLNGTDCVVMSACKTGLGEIRNQEGVYGLQRSFLIAGSKAVIMSLWSVDDQATKDLMIAFYGHYSKNKDLDLAFHKAMGDIHSKYKEPYYWGAFVLMKK